MDVSGIRSFTELSAQTTTPNDELGKNQFLELMIAQLNHQDPLSPAENEDFIAQLAQFSTLEGVENLNKSMETMANSMRSEVTMQAASLVGRSVLVPTNQALMRGQGLVGSVNVGASTSDVVVEITSGGATVRRLSLGPQAAGESRFQWDGFSESGEPMPAGVYNIRAYSTGNGEPEELLVDLPEQVVSVTLNDTGAQLNLAGGGSVPVTDVKEIQ